MAASKFLGSSLAEHLPEAIMSSPMPQDVIGPTTGFDTDEAAVPISFMNPWADLVYRYFAGTDTFILFIARATPGVIAVTEDVEELTVALDDKDKIVSIDFPAGSQLLVPHLDDTTMALEGKPALALNAAYSVVDDRLRILLAVAPFVEDIQRHTSETMPFLSILRFSDGRIVGIEIQHPAAHVSPDIAQEERQKLAAAAWAARKYHDEKCMPSRD
ncbi:hypothetical protein HDU87_007690 [Geranomyces variabilis]|uniref:Uncharacterized protein n=1 Tax=Geranomyces variabilis TaxID=109894 RepID=A0AAD5TDT3_9FUNG|nr:hypothetical protein HDU87_007690 [Geranomyces variabilis]